MKKEIMKKEIFNTTYKRADSDSEKWNTYPQDTLPLWVADSDYAVPKEVIEALQTRLSHPVLGYGLESEKFRTLIVARMKKLYNWDINPEWICFTPGVVPGLNACRAIMGETGTNAVTAIPVYPHLQNPSPVLERPMKFFHMKLKDGRFEPDFDELNSVIDEKTRMLMLCHPHNPVGSIYTREELLQFADIAEQHDLLICSDDIHADFALYEDTPYVPLASLSPAIAARTITLMAASKTFNIAGLNCAYAIIPDETLRHQFGTQLKGLVGGVNILGFVASEAAYEYGEEWLAAQIEHLRKNAEYCYQRINDMPLLSMTKMEATFLAWVNARELNEVLQSRGLGNAYTYLLSHEVAVSDGSAFGDKEYIRLNLATGLPVLKEALERIEKALLALS